MRAILDFGFWISDSRRRQQEPGARATGRYAITATAFLFMLITGCASAPSYPQPQGSNGQILVQLSGEAKDGVRGPKKREVRGEYSTTRESVEKGANFERVDYDEIEDVVVIVSGADDRVSEVPILPPDAAEIQLDENGFGRSQYLTVKNRRGPEGRASFTFRNLRDEDVNFYAVNENDGFIEGKVSAGALGTFSVSEAGRYDLYCEEDDSLHCVLFVSDDRLAWIGSSDSDAFYNYIPPGEYTVAVHAPRLPEWSKRLTVSAGKRETVTAELTVNKLPKVGK